MLEIITVGHDLVKNVFQAHGADASGRTVLRKKLRRDQVLDFFGQLPSCVVAMEACGGAHFWGHEIGKLGHVFVVEATKLHDLTPRWPPGITPLAAKKLHEHRGRYPSSGARPPPSWRSTQSAASSLRLRTARLSVMRIPGGWPDYGIAPWLIDVWRRHLRTSYQTPSTCQGNGQAPCADGDRPYCGLCLTAPQGL